MTEIFHSEVSMADWDVATIQAEVNALVRENV
jgi:hypothetical protein